MRPRGSIDEIGMDAPREDAPDGGSVNMQMQISLEGPKGNHGE